MHASKDSGEYYLVTNRIGSRSLVKRPHAPLTSHPLDDDFDAYTQGATTTQGPATLWNGRVRDSRFPETASPLNDDFDAFTYTAPAETELGRNEGTWIKKKIVTDATNDGDWKSWTQASDRRAKYVHKRASDESFSTKSAIARRTKALAAASSPKSPKRSKSSSRAHSSRNNNKPQAGKGLEYEIIDKRVVEDTPQRTVTIATWREDVVRKTKPDVEMSIYYVDPDEYAVAEDDSQIAMKVNAFDGSGKIVEKRVRRRLQHPSSPDAMTKMHKSSSFRRTTSDPPYQARSTAVQSPQQITVRSFSPPAPRPVSPHPSTSRSAPTPPSPTSKPSLFPEKFLRSSTPNLDKPNYGRTTSLTSSRPFHATQSGSTISSIVGPATPRDLEDMLRGCRPSLIHLIGPLADMGIRSTEHIAAVGRLSGEGKKEVKAEAYRRGVSVVEWAILVDLGKSIMNGG